MAEENRLVCVPWLNASRQWLVGEFKDLGLVSDPGRGTPLSVGHELSSINPMIWVGHEPTWPTSVNLQSRAVSTHDQWLHLYRQYNENQVLARIKRRQPLLSDTKHQPLIFRTGGLQMTCFGFYTTTIQFSDYKAF